MSQTTLILCKRFHKKKPLSSKANHRSKQSQKRKTSSRNYKFLSATSPLRPVLIDLQFFLVTKKVKMFHRVFSLFIEYSVPMISSTFGIDSKLEKHHNFSHAQTKQAKSLASSGINNVIGQFLEPAKYGGDHRLGAI